MRFVFEIEFIYNIAEIRSNFYHTLIRLLSRIKLQFEALSHRSDNGSSNSKEPVPVDKICRPSAYTVWALLLLFTTRRISVIYTSIAGGVTVTLKLTLTLTLTLTDTRFAVLTLLLGYRRRSRFLNHSRMRIAFAHTHLHTTLCMTLYVVE